MPTGKVKWFDQHRRYGFIEPDGPGGDLFMHCNELGCHPNLKKGEPVHYQLARNRVGRVAVNVQLIIEEVSDAK